MQLRLSPAFKISSGCHRLFTTTTQCSALPPFTPAPAPPRLSGAEQKIYEQLVSSSNGAFSSPRPTVVANQNDSHTTPTSRSSQPGNSHSTDGSAKDLPVASSSNEQIPLQNARVRGTSDGAELHPDVRRGAKPEFEGERNPKTGEIGGPKNEPLRWGSKADWSYNGRVTDF